jgi:hypothetical protein
MLVKTLWLKWNKIELNLLVVYILDLVNLLKPTAYFTYHQV